MPRPPFILMDSRADGIRRHARACVAVKGGRELKALLAMPLPPPPPPPFLPFPPALSTLFLPPPCCKTIRAQMVGSISADLPLSARVDDSQPHPPKKASSCTRISGGRRPRQDTPRVSRGRVCAIERGGARPWGAPPGLPSAGRRRALPPTTAGFPVRDCPAWSLAACCPAGLAARPPPCAQKRLLERPLAHLRGGPAG